MENTVNNQQQNNQTSEINFLNKKRGRFESNDSIDNSIINDNIDEYSEKSKHQETIENADPLKNTELILNETNPDLHNNRFNKLADELKGKLLNIILKKSKYQDFKLEDYIIPVFDGPLISLSVFKELQIKEHDEEEVLSAYNKYKNFYEESKSEYYYKEHESEEWFKEKYNIEYSSQIKSQINQQISNKAKLFFEKFQLQEYDDTNFTYDINDEELIKKENENFASELKEAEDSDNVTEINKRKCYLKVFYNNYYIKNLNKALEPDQQCSEYTENNSPETVYTIDLAVAENLLFQKKYSGIDPDKNTIFLHQISKYIPSKCIYELVSQMKGFISMYFSEPIRSQNNIRLCWINFEDEDSLKDSLDKLSAEKLSYQSIVDINKKFINTEGFKFFPIKSEALKTKKLNITPMIDASRITEDIVLTKKLIEKLDKAMDIENNAILQSEYSKNLDDEQLLDIQIAYLRIVHCYCYYCAAEFENERVLVNKCGNTHLRNHNILESTDSSEEATKARKWNNNVILANEYVLNSEINEDSLNFNEAKEEKTKCYLDKNTYQVEDGIFKCQLCSKMFHGANFVHNHILNRHKEAVKEDVEVKLINDLKFKLFFKDSQSYLEKHKQVNSLEEYFQALTLNTFHSNYNSLNKDYSNNNFNDDKRREYKGDRQRRTNDSKYVYRDLDDPNSKTTNGFMEIEENVSSNNYKNKEELHEKQERSFRSPKDSRERYNNRNNERSSGKKYMSKYETNFSSSNGNNGYNGNFKSNDKQSNLNNKTKRVNNTRNMVSYDDL